ncbi:MAG: phosphotyrosine protein phosphatase [Lachnospiraceae bacterium]|nr:phosphotyrosine protein phosphatase [Lachnospiraceae bacterium]
MRFSKSSGVKEYTLINSGIVCACGSKFAGYGKGMVINMLQYNRIIFVSESDTCRGPLAAAIMKNMHGMENVDIASKGTVSLFQEPANQKAVAVAKSNGIDIGDYQSEQLSYSDFSMETLMLVMSDSMKKKIYEDFAEAVNVYTIKEFVGETGDVEVPYGGELADYGSCFEELHRLIDKIIEKLRNMA